MSKSKIGTFEAIMLISSIVAPYTVISLPWILIEETKSSVILNIIFVTILTLLFIVLICKLFSKFPGFDILDVSNFLGGKSFKNIIGILFIFYFLLSSSILLRNFAEGLKTVFYPMTNIVFIILLFVISIGFVNSFGFSSTLNVTTIIFPIVLVSVLLLFFGNFKNFSTIKLFPVLGNSFYDTFVLGLSNIGTFGGIAYIYFLQPLLKQPEKFKKISIISISVSGLFILLCIITLLFMFSFSNNIEPILPLFTACKYIEFGSFFQRFESLFLLIWIIAFCCYLSIACKFASLVFKKLFNINNINKLTCIFALLIFSISLLPKNYAVSFFLETNIYRYLRITILFALCFFILLFANLKKKKEGA